MKKALVLAIVLGAAWWIYKNPQWWSKLEDVAEPIVAAQEETFYRWRDAQGTVQLTDDRPPQGIPYEIVKIDPDANVIPSIKEQ